MYHEMLTFGTVLRIAVCVKVVLAYVQPSDCSCFVGRRNFVNGLMLNGLVSRWCVVFPRRSQHLLDPVDGPFGWGWDLSDGSRVVDIRGHMIVYDVLLCSSFNAKICP